MALAKGTSVGSDWDMSHSRLDLRILHEHIGSSRFETPHSPSPACLCTEVVSSLLCGLWSEVRIHHYQELELRRVFVHAY